MEREEKQNKPVKNQISVNAKYAGFWVRLLAATCDGVILLGVGLAGQLIFDWLFNAPLVSVKNDVIQTSLGQPGASLQTGFNLLGLVGVTILIFTAIDIIYYVGLTSAYGGTLGKLILGLRVVDKNGQRISLRRATLREIIGKWVSALVFCLGFLWIAFDPKKQSWHDKLANTYVVKIR